MSRSTARGRIFGPLLGRFLPPEIDPNVIALALEILGASTTEQLLTTGELASALSLLGASVTDGTQTSGTAGIISIVSAATNQPTIATDGAIALVQSFAGSSQTPALATVGSVEAPNPYDSSVMAAFSGVEWFINQSYADIASSVEFSFRVLADVSPSSTGRIFESGGDDFGTCLYAHNGSMYFQCGAGGGPSNPQNYGITVAEVIWPIPLGVNEYLVEGSAKIVGSSATLAIYIDGVLIETTNAQNIPTLSGADSGAVSPIAGTITPAIRGLADSYSDNIALNKIDIYPNQSTADVLQIGSGGFVTNGMEEIPWVVGTNYLDLSNTRGFSAKFSITIAADSAGDLLKSGGTGVGLAVYAHAGKLYFQGGVGGETNRNYGVNVGETFWDITPGTHLIEISALSNANGAKLAIYVDGVLIPIGTATFDGSFGGSGVGVVLPTTASPFHRGTRNLAFNGTLIDDTVFIYPDQSTSDVQ